MLDKIKQLMEMKKQADQMKRQLDQISLEIADVHGIRIKISGSQKFQALEIEDSLLIRENKKLLESDLLRSINLAVEKSQAAAAQRMKDMVGFNLPGM